GSALQAGDGALGEWLGQRYADRYLGEADAARARAVATAVRDALRDRLRQADWLEPSSRDAGVAKAEAMQVVIGHQDAAPEAALPTLSSTDHAANMMAIAAWRQKAALARLGEAPAPAPLRGHHVNAFYDAAANR